MTPVPPPAAVSEPDPRDLAWQALAQELAPAKSLARIDTATTRVVTNVTVAGTALTALGLLAAGLPGVRGAARGLAIAAVATAVAAVGAALTAQLLTVVRGLNTNDLVQVRNWYARQFRRRAYPARAATVLLLLAICLAGAAAGVALLSPEAARPVLAVSRTDAGPDGGGAALTVDVSFPGLAATDVLSVTITATTPGSRAVVGRAVVTPGSNGTAARSLTVMDVPHDAALDVSATGGRERCQARLGAAGAGPAAVHCGRVG